MNMCGGGECNAPTSVLIWPPEGKTRHWDRFEYVCVGGGGLCNAPTSVLIWPPEAENTALGQVV